MRRFLPRVDYLKLKNRQRHRVYRKRAKSDQQKRNEEIEQVQAENSKLRQSLEAKR